MSHVGRVCGKGGCLGRARVFGNKTNHAATGRKELSCYVAHAHLSELQTIIQKKCVRDEREREMRELERERCTPTRTHTKCTHMRTHAFTTHPHLHMHTHTNTYTQCTLAFARAHTRTNKMCKLEFGNANSNDIQKHSSTHPRKHHIITFHVCAK